jgi:hypothetical protein
MSPAPSLQPAEFAAVRLKRLHPRSVFADYRKAANNDGFAAALRGVGRHQFHVSAGD